MAAAARRPSAAAAATPAAAAAAAAVAAPLPPPSLEGERANMALLLFLYFLQGLPMGLASSIPLFLAAKGASFSDQALFSLASWPYSLKILWAPVVDALWTPRFRLGQRKSWIVPVQLLTGAAMVALGARIGDFFGGGGAEAAGGAVQQPTNVWGLTVVFFGLYFLVATQDIAVDGWALTVLRRENVGFASTANTIGQSVGVMTSYSLFMALDSAAVCNRYLRAPLGLPPSAAGLVTMGGFMAFWGAVFIVSTLIVWAVKVEAPPPTAEEATSLAVAAVAAECDAGVGAAAAHATGKGAGAGAGAGRGADAPPPRSAAASGHSSSRSRSSSGSGVRRRSNGTGASQSQSQGQAEDGDGAAALVIVDGKEKGRPRQEHGRGQGQGRRGAQIDVEEGAGQGEGEGEGDGEGEGEWEGGAEDEGRRLLAGAAGAAASGGAAATAASAAGRRPAPAPSPPPPSSSAPPPPAPLAPSALSSVAATYRDGLRVLALPAVLQLVLVMVTLKAGFQASDRAAGLVLQARGVPKEALAMLDMASFPLQMAVQVALAHATAGARPLTRFVLGAFPLRAAFGLLWLAVVFVLLPDRTADPWLPGDVPWPVLGLVFALSNAHGAVQTLMFMGQMAFFNRVSSLDPRIGGTYMTLLNTATNLGAMWPGPLALKAIDVLTVSACDFAPARAAALAPPVLAPWNATTAAAAAAEVCKGSASEAACAALGGVCAVRQSGFALASLLGVAYCAVWWLLMAGRVRRLQALDEGAWRAPTKA